ncbi:hypothetical protein ACP70R_015992 [Stipagrostis hirtigluma subsp. patula]
MRRSATRRSVVAESGSGSTAGAEVVGSDACGAVRGYGGRMKLQRRGMGERRQQPLTGSGGEGSGGGGEGRRRGPGASGEGGTAILSDVHPDLPRLVPQPPSAP